MRTLTKSLTTKKAKTNKLVLGFVGIAATTIIGTAGVAAAQQTKDPNMPNPPSKAACANFAQYGFKNHGQCVSWWETHNNPGQGQGQGHGYGGSSTNNVTTNVNVDPSGGHNVISVVVNYFFG
ncbi:MAG TPA: hypothetical protein VGM08_03145 [Candidatus Saccharimonadales bacterium]|jgi:hypothetical protein